MNYRYGNYPSIFHHSNCRYWRQRPIRDNRVEPLKAQLTEEHVSGKFSQAGMNFDLTLQRLDVAQTQALQNINNRPQEPKPPYPYLEQNVSIPHISNEFELTDTLTTPEQGAPFAAVILVSGSGPQHRDETLFNHKSFKVLADYLTRHSRTKSWG